MGNGARMFATLALAAGTVGCIATFYEPQPEAPPPAPPPAAASEPEVSGDAAFFYDSLSPYGAWMTVATYGVVWVPRVDPWWRPYSDGRWVYTDAGWTWVANERWGWAAFHYGRWYWDTGFGWTWVPGTVWAPAWVAWRSGGGHIGWAPLPPQVRWEVRGGLSYRGADFTAVIAPQNWCFVEERDIAAPSLREVVVPRARNVTFVNVTNNITNYTVINDRIVNNSITVNRVEQVTSRPVPRYRIADRESAAALQTSGTSGDEIPMVRRLPAGRRDAGGDTGAADRRGPPARNDVRAPVTARPPAPVVTGAETVVEVNRRHDAEQEALAAHAAEAKARLQAIQRNDQAQAQANASAEQVRARHLAEQKALEAQQRDEAKVLQARHQRELENAKKVRGNGTPPAKATPKPKPSNEDDKH